MSCRARFIGVAAFASIVSLTWAQPSSKPAAKDTQITSDELAIQKGGESTLFTGNVLLRQIQQHLQADQMTRSRLTGIATARGHVRGTWFSEKGEKVIATGDSARYTPAQEVTELWGESGRARMTRWETAKDTAPVTIDAWLFTARKLENTIDAEREVRVVQPMRLVSESDFARYDRAAGTLTLWGRAPVDMSIQDGKGTGHFTSERAVMNLNPRRARLTGNVRGHVIPEPRL